MDKEQIIAMGRTYVDGSDAGILFFANALLSANRKQAADDAQPVAIYQVIAGYGVGVYRDCSQEEYERAGDNNPFRRIVYVARAAEPSAASIFAPEVPWWKVIELAEKHGKGWSQISGWAFLNDDALHAFACDIAASAPRDK